MQPKRWNRARQLLVRITGRALLAAVTLYAAATTSNAATFIQANPAGGNWGAGMGTPGAGDVVRWNQANIRYSFTPAFTAWYGAAGQAAVANAFGTWNGAVGAAVLPGANRVAVDGAAMAVTDPAIIGPLTNYDLESVALHEIGHALGLDHPDVPGAMNFNVAGGAWVAGALPAGSQPVMWSTAVANTRTRALTNDDLYGVQWLYTAGAAGAGNGALGGPTFGGGTPFTFAAAGANPVDITIDVGGLSSGTLASTIGSGPAPGVGQSWQQLNSATITFSIPTPGGMAVLVVTVLMPVRRRRRAA